MTLMAFCPQCMFPFSTHTNHPVTPAHDHPATGLPCAGACQPALTEIS